MFFGLGIVPCPKFRKGELVECPMVTNPAKRYIVVRRRRWTCPRGYHRWRWVYDGFYIVPREGELVVSDPVSGVFEKVLEPVIKAELTGKPVAAEAA